MKIADIYLRVSTKPQENGDGYRRQEESCRQWCDKNNVQVRSVIKEACSAYDGLNFYKGLLGEKIDQWRKNKWNLLNEPLTAEECPESIVPEQAPDYLVVESPDRLTRANRFQVQILLMYLLAICSDVVFAYHDVKVSEIK